MGFRAEGVEGLRVWGIGGLGYGEQPKRDKEQNSQPQKMPLSRLDQPQTKPKGPSTLFLLGAWHILSQKITGYIDPFSSPFHSIPEYNLQLRTPPVLGFPRTLTGGADA